MFKSLVVQHFGGVVKTADALGIRHPAISRWGDVIPEKQAMRLERITKGVLRYDPSLYQNKHNQKS
ncbi:Cro/CI family transcriptional regulator [Erwinia sp. SLM-02]|uniref:Cro/CI family transcriptional regulator n=1 Tax=Erwinia sp. SLM-02 TaxID=3020057 RepID=UPI003080DE31